MASLVDSTSSRQDFLTRFNRRLVAQRVPIAGMIEVTSRCNLRCVHCYHPCRMPCSQLGS
jgi:molybdenum cofactor biosynthesis enzyme MoaA